MNNSQIRKYMSVNFDIKSTGALLGEVDNQRVIIQPNAALPDYMDMIVDKIREVIKRVHAHKYTIDYIVVRINNNNKLIVTVKLLKDWIEVFDYAKNL